MRPSLTPVQNAMLLAIGRKNPQQLDPFEAFVRGQIAGLSREIERLQGEAARLAEELKEAEQAAAAAVGQYQGVASTIESYYAGRAKAGAAPAPEVPAPEPEPGAPEVPAPAAGDSSDRS